jgi:hypothetical protein
MSDEEEKIFDGMGRINLPAPSAEALEQAAEDVLGPTANEALFPDGGKLFRGVGAPGAFFLQGPDEDAGTILTVASPEMRDALMAEARKVREARAEEEGDQFLDPSTNPMIKLDQD